MRALGSAVLYLLALDGVACALLAWTDTSPGGATAFLVHFDWQVEL